MPVILHLLLAKCKWNFRRFVLLSIIVLLTLSLFAVNNNILNVEKVKNIKESEFPDTSFLQYSIKNDICKSDVFLLILVHSAPNHFQHRRVIRSTWGNPGSNIPTIKVAFLLAATSQFQSDIEEENKQNKDIVQGSFQDSYRNLTYKHIMGLAWAFEHCKQAKYLLKMDDDIFMDIYQLVDYIKSSFKNSILESNIACYHQKGMPVVRDPVSKWYVSKEEFAADKFDDYCSGWAYLTTIIAAQKLYHAAIQMPYFWVDDVHVTGTAARKAKIGWIKLNNLYDLETDGLADWNRSTEIIKWNKIFAPTWGDLVLSKDAHRKAFKCHVFQCACCYARKTEAVTTAIPTTVKGIAKLISIIHKQRLKP